MAAKGRRVVFLGDMLELGPSGPDLHRETGTKLRGQADVVVGVGTLGRLISEGARTAGIAEVHAFDDSTAAGAAATGIVKEGDAVLVKGSRGARMERVVEALRNGFGVEGA
jgi:UDP-N-acetylmuramoyl-tripeptide--D-alanyl-D-alanine ligase